MTHSQTDHPWMIYWAILVHMSFGLALLIDPEVAPAVILAGMHWLIALGVGGYWLGAALLIAAVLALISLVAGHRLGKWVSLALLAPQYMLLIAAFLSDGQSILSGALPDGRAVDRLVLFVALCGVMWAGVLHSIAIVERHVYWTKPS